MGSSLQPLDSPRVSQIQRSPVQPCLDTAEWQVANRQRFVEIKVDVLRPTH